MSYARRLRRALERGKRPEDITYKCKPHGGRMQLYDTKDQSVTNVPTKRGSKP